MSEGFTKNTALPTVRGLHYQILVGLSKCFDLKEGQTIFFEKDGDVSLIGNKEDSTQVEVKHYKNDLTDNHLNFWKTLANWTTEEFDHSQYSSLVLLTTQKFGSSTILKDWNDSNAEKRYEILSFINEGNKNSSSNVKCFQESVLSIELDELKKIVGKVSIISDADDIDNVRSKIYQKLYGIPEANKEAYVNSLLGHLFSESSSNYWKVDYRLFTEWNQELTSRFQRSSFTFPEFHGNCASDEEVSQQHDQLFVQKILAIELSDEVPKAVGNWLEVIGSEIR